MRPATAGAARKPLADHDEAASNATPKRAARILMGIAYIAGFMPEIRCHCYGFYYAAIGTLRRGN
jgi:hypothetical protein